MKILHTVEYYHHSVGGMQEVVRQIAEQLVKLSHDVTVATTKLPTPDGTRLAFVAKRDKDEYYAVDAAHMLGIAAPPPEQLRWNMKALALAEAATDPRARDWRASLYHNIGWTWFEGGKPDTALEYWQKALAARETMGNPSRTRVARWTVARGYRAVGRLDDAEAAQKRLLPELTAGVAGRWGILSAAIAPSIAWQQNADFEIVPNGQTGNLVSMNAWYGDGIDLPQRFGDAPF